MKITERYATAVNTSNLKSVPDTIHSASDVLGAYGIADRRLSEGEDQYTKHPLAVPLERLFAGDSASAGVIVQILAGMIRGKAPGLRCPQTETQAVDMARAVLGWFRKPACQACGGHGFKVILNTTTLGDNKCRPCNGTGKVPLELLYRLEQRELVRWAIARMEFESAMAGPAAMRALGNSLDL